MQLGTHCPLEQFRGGQTLGLHAGVQLVGQVDLHARHTPNYTHANARGSPVCVPKKPGLPADQSVYVTYTMKRYQIYLDEAQHLELCRRAERSGTSVSSVIRRALDAELALPDGEERLEVWRRAVAETAGSAAYLPEGRV